MTTTWNDLLPTECGDFPECHDDDWPCDHVRQSRLIAQAIDYSAAADKARHEPHLEAAHTAALQATLKALAIVMNGTEADATEMFMEALEAS